MEEVKVTFQPEGRRIYALRGMTIAEVAARAGIIIDSPCGGLGNCGQCRVEVIEGADVPTPEEKRHLSSGEIKKGYRLACITTVKKEMNILIPEEVRLHRQKFLAKGKSGKVKFSPPLRKVLLKLTEPTLENPQPDWENLILSNQHLNPEQSRRVVPEADVDIYMLREISEILRRNKFRVTAIVDNGRLIGIEPGDTSKHIYGVALDIGTTTVVGSLINLNNGEQVAVASAMNSQVVHGDDTISRINFASKSSEGLNKLTSRIVEVVNNMIEEVSKKAGIDTHDIYYVTCAGNTTMHHLFLGISPRHLGQMPFVPAITRSVALNTQKLKIDINPNGRIYFLPNIAGFVGADIVGVIMATGIDRAKDIKMAIDIGTNGEIVLGSKEKILVCSTAAGPAFEGARITHGMRGAPGAIEKVIINKDEVSYEVIGGIEPQGICGSGLLDLVAEMIKAGLVDETGRFLNREEVKSDIGSHILERIQKNGEEISFVVAENKVRKIEINQRDLRQFQLAKGAIRTGIEMLKKKLGIKDKDISEVFLAGAFGNYIHPENAKVVGLIPDIPLERIKFVGNAASEGAKMVLLSQGERERAEEISKGVEHVELSVDPAFNEEFSKQMLFNRR